MSHRGSIANIKFAKSLLNKGLNFAATIKRILHVDLIAPTETAAFKIPKDQAEPRWNVRQALEKSKPPNPNISKEERLVIKLIPDDENIILPADNDNATVVMVWVEYSNKLVDMNSRGDYGKIKKNPLLYTERKLSQILCKNKDLIPQIKYRQLTQHYCKLPYIYSVQKYIKMVFH